MCYKIVCIDFYGEEREIRKFKKLSEAKKELKKLRKEKSNIFIINFKIKYRNEFLPY